MFKKFFDTLALNSSLKIKKEALTTLSADIDLCLEMMEHPVKKQAAIKELLKDMKKVCDNANK